MQLQTALRLLEGARVLSGTARAGIASSFRSISQWHHEVEAQQQQQQQQLEQQPHAAVSPLLQQPGSIQQHWPQQQLLLQQQHSRHGLHSTHQQHQQQPYAWSSSRALHTQDSSGPSSQELYEDYTASMQESQDEASSSSQLSTRIGNLNASQELDELLKVLLHPMPRSARWNQQLSPYLLQVNEQLLLQPSSVLLSVVRALHVLRGVLQENGQVYVVENNQKLQPLVKTAALSCINPNVWFDHRTWSPGTLTNFASSRRLFKESHQPNRRLFAAKGYRMVNPLLPRANDGTGPVGALPPLQTPVPRLSNDDKWLLYRRLRRPGFRALLQTLMENEDALHTLKPAGSLKGVPQDLSLMIFLDSTKNAVAIKEAYNRNIPTIAIVNTSQDMSHVTYPVLARDFSPGFVHFFLDWIIKVANTPLPGSQLPPVRKSKGKGGKRRSD